MTKRIFRSIIAVAMTVLFASLLIATTFLYDYFKRSQTLQLSQELELVSKKVFEQGLDYFENYESSVFRFTVISLDGEVLYDTEFEAAELSDHSDREEVREAIKTGRGSSSRLSEAMTEKTVYEAIVLEGIGILRVSAERVTVSTLLLGMLPAFSAIILFAIIMSLLLSSNMAKIITVPLNRIDLENPNDEEIYEELIPIMTKMKSQHKQISKQKQQLRQRTDELEQVTGSMSEAIVLIDSKGRIINMNPAAKRLFSVHKSVGGMEFSNIDMGQRLKTAVEAGLEGRHSELQEQRGELQYQFSVNPIESEGRTAGVAILGFDITERAFAERSRREFTANVSHELKTPLQSIIGSAELLENGLVKPQDTARFVGNIKNEAQRLVSLINDIIRLSQLDEANAPCNESVDLLKVAKEALAELYSSAQGSGIELSCEGMSTFVEGVRRYIYEIIYNLCDNAVRYNKKGGKVWVSVFEDNNGSSVRVSDTGIGIPPEHRARVFERFYRVDKSHSRQTGGTGLGLSIVKHAVSYHGGKIDLKSEVGKGTQITVTFPRKLKA